jgi:hypothetical protein
MIPFSRIFESQQHIFGWYPDAPAQQKEMIGRLARMPPIHCLFR